MMMIVTYTASIGQAHIVRNVKCVTNILDAASSNRSPDCEWMDKSLEDTCCRHTGTA